MFWLDEDLNRRPSSMSASFRIAAGGAASSDLPAYELQPPVSTWLAGWLPHMAHWQWQPPPPNEITPRGTDATLAELQVKTGAVPSGNLALRANT